MSETQLSASIRSALTRMGVWCMRIQSGRVRTRGGFVQLAEAGTPDILLVGPASVAGSWLEVKTEKGRLETSQPIWHERARKMGIRVATVRTISEAVTVVRGWMRGAA